MGIRDKGGRKGKEQGEGGREGYFSWEGAGQRTASGERGDRCRHKGKWQFIKVQEEACVRMRCLIVIGHLNYVNQGGLLIAGLQYLDSWTLVVGPRRKKWPNKVLGCSFRNVI